MILAGGLIWYNPSWKFIDPIATFLFSALVIWTTFPVTRDAVRVLMEEAPREYDINSIQRQFLSIEVRFALQNTLMQQGRCLNIEAWGWRRPEQGVEEVHDLHIWSLSIGKTLGIFQLSR